MVKVNRRPKSGLLKLQDDYFDVIVVRPPNVYGKGCKRRVYSRFCKRRKKLPVIPALYTGKTDHVIYR